MGRLIAALVCGLALAVAAPAGSDAYAAKKKAKVAAKICKVKGPTGKPISWKCAKSQKCCYNAFLAQGTCGSTPFGCL